MPNILHNAVVAGDEDGRPDASHLRLLGKLASSLDASQQALLSGDAGQLEQLTAEQAVLWARILPLGEGDDKPVRSAGVPGDAGGTSALWAAQKRILHLARVQLAILRRAGQRSRILSTLLVGTRSEYAPAGQNHAIAMHAGNSR